MSLHHLKSPYILSLYLQVQTRFGEAVTELIKASLIDSRRTSRLIILIKITFVQDDGCALPMVCRLIYTPVKCLILERSPNIWCNERRDGMVV
jgi:hypothetical protein